MSLLIGQRGLTVASARATAAKVIRRVLEGESLHRLLPSVLDGIQPPSRALCQELIYGSLREWPLLAPLSRQFLKKPLRSKDADIQALICIGLYEQSHLKTPAHAALSETVNAAKDLKKHWATGLVNGVLRNHQRQGISLEALSPAQRAALPDWLYNQLVTEYGDGIEGIAAASRSRPPMVLRVNTLKISRSDYLTALTAVGIDAEICQRLGTGIILSRGVDVFTLPGFSEGWASVQDRSAQLVAGLINPQAGERILDACSAPGGKACHLLEYQPNIGELVACDISETRLTRVAENSARLGLSMKMVKADAKDLPPAIISFPFDAILADVPCSATGVMRRNPDVKLHRRETDLEGFAEQQLAILRGLWPALKPGGRLLYVTCSILRAENDDVIRAFCEEPGVEVTPLPLTEGVRCEYGWQTLPQVDDGDGLYFSLLKKQYT